MYHQTYSDGDSPNGLYNFPHFLSLSLSRQIPERGVIFHYKPSILGIPHLWKPLVYANIIKPHETLWNPDQALFNTSNLSLNTIKPQISAH